MDENPIQGELSKLPILDLPAEAYPSILDYLPQFTCFSL